MRFLRDLLTLLALLFSVGVASIAVVKAVRSGLPAVVQDDHEAFVRRLTVGDVRDLPPDQQLRQMRQLERELRRGVDWEADYVRFKHRQRRLLVENLISLAELWVREKMSEWRSLPSVHQQDRYLDGEIHNLRNMKSLQDGAFVMAMNSRGGLARALLQSAALRFAQLPDKVEWTEFAAAARKRWTEKGMGELLPASGSPRD